VAIAATFAGLVLNRIDLGALAVVPLVLTAWEVPRRTRARALALGCAPLAAWFGFSLVYYGAWLPNTAVAKLAHGIPRDEILAQGAVYLVRQLEHDPVSVGVIVAGVVVPVWRRDLRALALGVGGWLYVAYVVKVGGDFMLGRFFTAPFVAAVGALLVTSRGASLGRARHAEAPVPRHGRVSPGGREAWLAAAVGALALALSSPRGPWATSDASLRPEGGALIRAGISDERAYYFPGTAIVRLERAERWPLHGFGAAGARLAKPKDARERVVTAGEVGMRGYFAGPSVHIVDHFALTDPLLARLPARTDHGWRIGHFARHVPLGYVEWLRGEQPVLADPALAALHEQVVLVTRGALWSPARWRAIVALQRGTPQQAALAGRAAFFRDPIHYDVPAWAVREPKSVGYSFHGEGVIQISRARGTRVHFDSLQRGSGLELSLDHNDAYRITFERDGRALAEPVVIEPRKHARAGLDVRSIQVPDAAARDGYDTVWVEGIKRTDRLFALGHVRALASSGESDRGAND
jgi:arabinofuranosyltransferase